MEKKPFLTLQQVQEITKTYPTPFHIYDEKAIRENARKVKKAFAWNPGYKEYFAVKATPNPRLIQILHEEGFGCDCSSLPELQLSDVCGVKEHDIMFSSNVTPAEDYKLASDLNAIINFDEYYSPRFLRQGSRRLEGDHVLPLQSGRRLRAEQFHHGYPAGGQVRHDPRAAGRSVQVHEAKGC